MGELGFQGSVPQDVVSKKPATIAGILRNIFAIAIIATALFILWHVYRLKFGEIDHAADSVATTERHSAEVQSSPGGDLRTGGTANTDNEIILETVYRNAARGVTLRLPGVWRNAEVAGIKTPGVAHRFCVLSLRDGEMTAMFWPIFPDLLRSLKADAEELKISFTRDQGCTLKKERELKVRGKPARELQFAMPLGGVNVSLLVIRNWPVTYLLAITGQEKSREDWERIENTLEESIEIQ